MAKRQTPGDRPAERPDLFMGSERLFPEGNHEVLDQDGAPAVHVGGIRADHQEDHHGAEDAGDADREDVAESHGNAHLVVDRFESLRTLLSAGNIGQFLTGRGDVGINCGFVLDLQFAQFLLLRRNVLVLLPEFRPDGGIFLVRQDVGDGFFRQLRTDAACVPGELRRIQVGDCHNRQQNESHGTETAAPRAEQSAHLGFMRVQGGAVVAAVSAPGHPVQEHADDSAEHIEQIEVTEILYIIRTEKTFARRP